MKNIDRRDIKLLAALSNELEGITSFRKSYNSTQPAKFYISIEDNQEQIIDSCLIFDTYVMFDIVNILDKYVETLIGNIRNIVNSAGEDEE